MTGCCLKCRDHREMQDAEAVILKNGRPATRGKCVECDTKHVQDRRDYGQRVR